MIPAHAPEYFFSGFTTNFPIYLVQTYSIPYELAAHLSKSYGGRAVDVIAIAKNELDNFNNLVNGFPYIEAEVIFSIRHEWAIHAEDIIARRTRLAFLNKERTLQAIPNVIRLMANELKWDSDRKEYETLRCLQFMKHFGGPTPIK